MSRLFSFLLSLSWASCISAIASTWGPPSAFPGWDGPHYDAVHKCDVHMNKKAKYAYVYTFIRTPSPEELEYVKNSVILLEGSEYHTDVVVMMPDLVPLGTDPLGLPFRVVRMPKAGLSGPWFVFNLFRLTEYAIVVGIPVGAEIVRPLDFLFRCPPDIVVMHAATVGAPASTDFLVVRPQKALFDNLMSTLQDSSSFTEERGWLGLGLPCRLDLGVATRHTIVGGGAAGRPVCHGAIVAQASQLRSPEWFLWAWGSRLRPGSVRAVDPCVFRFEDGFLCTVDGFGETHVALPPAIGASNLSRSCTWTHEGCGAARVLTDDGGWPRIPETEVCKPSFFLLGTRRSGLVDTYVRLTRHPRVKRNKAWYLDKDPLKRAWTGDTMAFQKMGDTFWAKGTQGVAAVLLNNMYPEMGPADVAGEVTASYLGVAYAPTSMLRACPESSKNFKFVVAFREPVARAQSSFLMRVRHEMLGVVHATIGENYIRAHLANFRNRIARLGPGWEISGEPVLPTAGANIIYEGLYVSLVSRWLKFFPRNRFLFLCSEDDLWASEAVRDATMARVQRHLGLEPHLNVAGLSTPLSVSSGFPHEPHHMVANETLREELRAFYRPFNLQLRALTGVKCSWMQ